jgi:hypothetical protein
MSVSVRLHGTTYEKIVIFKSHLCGRLCYTQTSGQSILPYILLLKKKQSSSATRNGGALGEKSIAPTHS